MAVPRGLAVSNSSVEVVPSLLPSALGCPAMPNSNVHKHAQTTIAEDLRKEREADAKKLAKREKTERKLLINGEMTSLFSGMDMTQSGSGSGAAIASAAAAAVKRKAKAFGKGIKLSGRTKLGGIGKKKRLKVKLPGAAPIKPSLGLKKQGIRKPSALMRKTFKKMAKKRAMEM